MSTRLHRQLLATRILGSASRLVCRSVHPLGACSRPDALSGSRRVTTALRALHEGAAPVFATSPPGRGAPSVAPGAPPRPVPQAANADAAVAPRHLSGRAAGSPQAPPSALLGPPPAASPPPPAVEGSAARAYCAPAAGPVGSSRRAGGGNVGRRGAAHLQAAAGDSDTSRPWRPPRPSEERLYHSGKRGDPRDPVGASRPSAAPR